MSNSANSPESAPGAPSRQVFTVSIWRTMLLFPFSVILKLWSATLRFEVDDTPFQRIAASRRGILFIVWHNRLFIIPELYRRFRSGSRIFGLVSASRDGAWLASLFYLLGIGAIRGSGYFRAFGATRELLNVLAEGADIGITPDGSRGPVYRLRQGAILLAERANAPVLLVSARFEKSWRLHTWDGFYLPKPFSRVIIENRAFSGYAELGLPQDRRQAAARLQEMLMAITED